MIAWFGRHPNAANLLMAALMILGLSALPTQQRETFPALKNDKVEIRIIYKGATAEEVEDAICRRLEDSLESIVHLEELRCEARESLGVMTAVMQETGEMSRFLDDVKSAVDTIDDFPEETEQPIIKELGRTDKVISIAITGPQDPVALKAYAESFKSRLQLNTNVAEVEINGFSDHQLRIEISALRLRQLGISAADIAKVVQSQSIGVPVGQLQGPNEDVLLRFDDRATSREQLSDLVVVSSSSGAAIRLGDIATITDRFELDENKILFDGKRAALLSILKNSDQDILDIFTQVRDFVEAERQRMPKTMQLTLTQDVSSVVADRLNLLVTNGIQGLVLVFLVLWLFFSLRYSFWVAMGLPVSFLGALFMLPMMGITINMISMVGLLIAVGLLMDDAIVIAENIAVRLAAGEDAMTAACKGAQQVLPGVVSSFITTVLIFGSLAFISGELGQIMRVLPVVLIVVLSVSLLEAFLILPHHLGHSELHHPDRQPGRFRAGFERGFAHVRDNIFGRSLDFAVEYRYLTVGLVIMLLLLAIAMPAGGKLKFVGFPALEGDVIEARLLLPQGTPLAVTEALVKQISEAAQQVNAHYKNQQPEQQDLVRHITVFYNQNPDAYETGPHVARVIVDLLSTEVRQTSLHTFREAWREATGRMSDVVALNYTEPSVGPGGRALSIRLRGEDLEQVKSAAQQLRAGFERYAGVIDLRDDLRPGKREYLLRLKPSAGTLGFKAAQVAEQIRGAYQGIKIDEFPLGAEHYDVDLRLRSADRADIAELEQFSLINAQGELVPLSVVAEIEEGRGWARIHRINGLRTVTVEGDVQKGVANAAELLQLNSKNLFPEIEQAHPGVKIDIQGQSKESAETGASIAKNALLGMIGVYMLLALQFRGYLAPITVMSVIPTALIGVFFGHMLLGLDLTMPSMVGMASLFGVVVNDSILLVVFMREGRAMGHSVLSTAKQAARARFRPILLTSITTVAGLVPLLLEKSLQAQILIPLAASLAFGLTITTLIALYLVPALYCVLDDFGVLGEVEEMESLEAQ